MGLLFVSTLARAGGFEVLVERTSEEMHWFTVTALSVEYIHCQVGIPADGEGEPWVGCSFPARPLGRSDVPSEVAWAARQVRKALREREEPVARVQMAYVATERRVWLCDQVLLPSGLWNTGQMEFGLAGGQAHPAAGTFPQGNGESLLGCTGRPIEVPVQATRSVIAEAHFAQDPDAKQQLDQIQRLLPGALEALPPVPSVPVRQGVVPAHFVVRDGRPQPEGEAFAVALPTERTLGTRVTWLWITPEGPQEAGSTLVGGFPEDWSELSGPPNPEGHKVMGTLEVFATDVPPGHHWIPEAQGFERLHTAALVPQR
jgi:hypothetical protein